MAGRALAYPLAPLILPAVWWLLRSHDACHLGWAMLLGALAVSLPRALPGSVPLGLGSTSALLWEAME